MFLKKLDLFYLFLIKILKKISIKIYLKIISLYIIYINDNRIKNNL
jgi:hypothetical protein